MPAAVTGPQPNMTSLQSFAMKKDAAKTYPESELKSDTNFRDSGNKIATAQLNVFIRGQFPQPLPPALGQTKVLPLQQFSQQSATIKNKVMPANQYPKPLPPALGQIQVLPRPQFYKQSATVKRKAFTREQHPGPRPSKIGKEDLPGGFRKENIMSGRGSPAHDLAKGLVRVDNVKILFNAWA